MKTIPEINIHVPADKTIVRIPYGTKTRYSEFDEGEVFYVDSYLRNDNPSDGGISAVLVSLSSGKMCKLSYEVLQVVGKSEYAAIMGYKSEPVIPGEVNDTVRATI